MLNSSVVAFLVAFLAGLGNQGKSTAVGVELVERIESSSKILLRSASFFVRSSHAAMRAVIMKTSWKPKLSRGPGKCTVPNDSHVIDFDEWVDSTTLTPLVSLVENVPQ